MAKEFLNPFLKVIIGSVTNTDINNGKEIVPDRLKGTDVGNRMKWQWVANQIHSPMGPFFERVRDQMYRPEAGAPSFGQQIAPVAEKWARARIDPSQALVKRVDVGRGAETIASELKQKEEKIKINTEYELKDKMVGILANNRFTLGQPISPAVQQTLSKIMNDYLMKGKIREPDKSILFKDEAPRVPGEVRGVFSFAKLNQITQMQIFKEALDEQAYRAEGRPAEQKLLKNQSDQLSKVIQIMQLQKEQKMNQPISAERMGDTQQFQQSIPGGE